MSAGSVRPLRRRRTPVYLITGVDDAAMATTSLALQLSLPGAVAVRHVIDPVLARYDIPYDGVNTYTNPTGKFVIGGPMGDA